MHPRAQAAGGIEEIDHTVEAVERYVEVAVARGVDEIGFTEHVYYFAETRSFWELPYQLDRCRHSLDAYCDAILEGKRRGLPVKLGLEVDWVPEQAGELAELLAPYPWDYLLGSVHIVDGEAVDMEPGAWERLSVEDVWSRYFEAGGKAAPRGLGDVLAHLALL